MDHGWTSDGLTAAAVLLRDRRLLANVHHGRTQAVALSAPGPLTRPKLAPQTHNVLLKCVQLGRASGPGMQCLVTSFTLARVG